MESFGKICLPLWIWIHHIPRFWGQPHLASMHFSSFIEFNVEKNIVHEDVLMRVFTFSLNGRMHGSGIVISFLKR